MAKYHKPRAGSLGFSPRKRSKKETPRIKSYLKADQAKLLSFSGYKAGMTHIIAGDLDKNSPTSGMDVMMPVTVLECPPVVVFAIRAYTKGYEGLEVLTDVFAEKLDKNLTKRLSVPKEPKTKDAWKFIEENIDDITEFTALCHTQPSKSSVSKKKPDVMEIGIGGEVKDQLEYCKKVLGSEVPVTELFDDLTFIDVIAVTKGKGTQGPHKRWGTKLQKRKHKRGGHSRLVGCIAAWTPAAVRWFVPQRGQMGYHKRTEFNKLIVKIGEEGKEVTPSGGFINYGEVKGTYIIIKGSVPGPVKRLVRIRPAIRAHDEPDKIELKRISTASNAGA